MSKFSSKNKLIEKQLIQLNKKEEKLILEKEPGIIKNKLDPLKIKIEEKIPEKLQSTLNIAFEKLLDSIFEDTAIDVSSDISVLNTVLAQEGLTEDELTRMRREAGKNKQV